MDTPTPTIGDFFDEVYQTQFTEARPWLEAWQAPFTAEDRWGEIRQMGLEDGPFIVLIQDMLAVVQRWLRRYPDQAQRENAAARGRAFLDEIRDKALRLGVDLGQSGDIPTTPREAVANAP